MNCCPGCFLSGHSQCTDAMHILINQWQGQYFMNNICLMCSLNTVGSMHQCGKCINKLNSVLIWFLCCDIMITCWFIMCCCHCSANTHLLQGNASQCQLENYLQLFGLFVIHLYFLCLNWWVLWSTDFCLPPSFMSLIFIWIYFLSCYCKISCKKA